MTILKTREAEMLKELEALERGGGVGIDFSDIPEVTNWESARRGVFYRPVKKALSLRIDSDLIAWFKRGGTGYQTRINDALREYVKQKQG
ncbi:MAG: BrnA antitoxin family protein [Pseudomonadota bacterium]